MLYCCGAVEGLQHVTAYNVAVELVKSTPAVPPPNDTKQANVPCVVCSGMCSCHMDLLHILPACKFQQCIRKAWRDHLSPNLTPQPKYFAAPYALPVCGNNVGTVLFHNRVVPAAVSVWCNPECGCPATGLPASTGRHGRQAECHCRLWGPA